MVLDAEVVSDRGGVYFLPQNCTVNSDRYIKGMKDQMLSLSLAVWYLYARWDSPS